MKKQARVGELEDPVDLNSAAEKRASSNLVSGTNRHLSDMMALAVPLYISKLKAKGGPDAEDYKRATEFSSVLGERGDILLFGGGKKGECADMFNRTAEAVAILSYSPGGVTVFGSHFEAKL